MMEQKATSNWDGLLEGRTREQLVADVKLLSFLEDTHRANTLYWYAVAQKLWEKSGKQPQAWDAAHKEAEEHVAQLWRDARAWAEKEALAYEEE